MKHPLKLIALILLMFIVTQFIGLFVVNHYLDDSNQIPYGMGVSEEELEATSSAGSFTSIIMAFIFAIIIFSLLTKFKAKFVMRTWFFIVILIALGISFVAFLSQILPGFKYLGVMALILALPLTLSKVYSRNILTHNFTELLIYPGIAAIFVPLLSVVFLIALLVLISLYDAWAVWKSGLMQKMANFQIDNLKVFGGFFIPYLSKKQRQQVKKLKESDKSKLKKKKFKVNVAILGGGDIVFTIIAAGVMFKTLGLLSAILVIVGAVLALSYIMFFGKKKVYPAMPFISTGIFIMIGLSYLIL